MPPIHKFPAQNQIKSLAQWLLTFPTPVIPIPKDIGLGSPRLCNLQRKCMLKEQALL